MVLMLVWSLAKHMLQSNTHNKIIIMIIHIWNIWSGYGCCICLAQVTEFSPTQTMESAGLCPQETLFVEERWC